MCTRVVQEGGGDTIARPEATYDTLPSVGRQHTYSSMVMTDELVLHVVFY